MTPKSPVSAPRQETHPVSTAPSKRDGTSRRAIRCQEPKSRSFEGWPTPLPVERTFIQHGLPRVDLEGYQINVILASETEIQDLQIFKTIAILLQKVDF